MQHKKILVVDDEQDFGVLMRDFFAKRNHEVHIACSLADGMAILEREEPDHVFLNNNLPDGARPISFSFTTLLRSFTLSQHWLFQRQHPSLFKFSTNLPSRKS